MRTFKMKPLIRVKASNSVPKSAETGVARRSSPVKLDPKQVELCFRDNMMVKLVIRGLAPVQVAQRLGISETTVRTRTKELLQAYTAETMADLQSQKAIDLLRLEHATSKVMERLEDRRIPHPKDPKKVINLPADTGEVSNLVRLQERKSKLLGLDAATKLDVTPLRREYVGVDVDKV